MTDKIDSLIEGILNKHKNLAMTVEDLPRGEERQLALSYDVYEQFSESTSARLLNVVNQMKRLASSGFEDGEQLNNTFSDFDSVLDDFPQLSEFLDDIYTRIDSYLYENVTHKKNESFENSVVREAQRTKPQMAYGFHIDNSLEPWSHKLTEKPNAMVSLEESDNNHPYLKEIESFSAPEDWFKQKPVPPLPALHETRFVWVSTPEQLTDLINVLNSVEVFALDLEHHSYRTYYGITCLLQISTMDTDFIIDTLSLWHHMQMFLDPFTNPKILKIVHGCNNDILWLQRDFSLYLVGVFDTGQAARVLGLNSFSLSFLLKLHHNVITDKRFQMADWRRRPLTEELVKYARTDTHYLINSFFKLRLSLTENQMQRIFMLSQQVCGIPYVKAEFNTKDYQRMFKPSVLRTLDRRQHALAEKLYEWRDSIARDCDESPDYVIPARSFRTLTLEHKITSIDNMFRVCEPVPPLVRIYAEELFSVITNYDQRASITSSISSVSSFETYIPTSETVESLNKKRAISVMEGVKIHNALNLEIIDTSQELKQFYDEHGTRLSTSTLLTSAEGGPTTQSIHQELGEVYDMAISTMPLAYSKEVMARLERLGNRLIAVDNEKPKNNSITDELVNKHLPKAIDDVFRNARSTNSTSNTVKTIRKSVVKQNNTIKNTQRTRKKKVPQYRDSIKVRRNK
ncbi:hypothetical protein PCE1_000111 [Barthelona sp. PCE]